MDRYAELRARAAEFVAEWVQWGEVLVLAPVRAAAEEVALEACGEALLGVRRLAFRELVMELSAAELNRRALVPVGRFVREALAARVTAEALGAASSTYLGPVAGFPGLPPRARPPPSKSCASTPWTRERLRACGESGADLALPARRLQARACRAPLRRPRRARRTGPRRLLRRLQQLRQTAVVALDLAPRTRSGARTARLT